MKRAFCLLRIHAEAQGSAQARSNSLAKPGEMGPGESLGAFSAILPTYRQNVETYYAVGSAALCGVLVLILPRGHNFGWITG